MAVAVSTWGLKHCWFLFQMFRKLHSSYTDVMCNPFYNPGDRIQSRWAAAPRGLPPSAVCSPAKDSDPESQGENVFLSDFEAAEACFSKQTLTGISNTGNRRRAARARGRQGSPIWFPTCAQQAQGRLHRTQQGPRHMDRGLSGENVPLSLPDSVFDAELGRLGNGIAGIFQIVFR